MPGGPQRGTAGRPAGSTGAATGGAPGRAAAWRRAAACRRGLALAASLLLALLLPPLTAPARAQASFEDCQAQSDSAFRSAVERATEQQFAIALAQIDHDRLVDEAWRLHQMDELITRLGRDARTALAAERSWPARLLSNYSQSAAEELTTAFNARVYESREFKTRFDTMVQGIAAELARRIEEVAPRPGEAALRCVQTFLGSRYGGSIALVVQGALRREVPVPHVAPTSGEGVDLLANSAPTLAGAAALVMRRTLERVVSRVLQKLVGSLAAKITARLIPGVGAALIAYELVFGANSLLDDLQAELTGSEVKQDIRAGLAASLREVTSRHADQAGRAAADQVNRVWTDFKAQYRQLLALAEADPAFRAFVAAQPPERFVPLARITDIVLRRDGPAGVPARLADGTLDRALRLPEEALEIAATARGGFADAFAWSALAGPALPAVLALELPLRADPRHWTRETLHRLVALGAPAAVEEVLPLERRARDTLLLGLPADQLRALAARLPAPPPDGTPPLAVVAAYLDGLRSAEAANLLVQALLRRPDRIHDLAVPATQAAILRSADPPRAIAMATQDRTLWDVPGLVGDLDLVRSGRVPLALFWQTRMAGGVLLAGGALGLLLLLLRPLRWLLPFRRRSRPDAPSP